MRLIINPFALADFWFFIGILIALFIILYVMEFELAFNLTLILFMLIVYIKYLIDGPEAVFYSFFIPLVLIFMVLVCITIISIRYPALRKDWPYPRKTTATYVFMTIMMACIFLLILYAGVSRPDFFTLILIFIAIGYPVLVIIGFILPEGYSSLSKGKEEMQE